MPLEQQPSEELFVDHWGSQLYNDIFGPYLEDMKALPTWMFSRDKFFWADLYEHTPKKKGQSGLLKFPCPKDSLVLETSENWCHSDAAALPEIPPDHPAIDAFVQMQREAHDWVIKRRELHNQLNVIVNECNTSHQLFRAWPTALKYAEKCFPYEAPAPAKQGGNTSISAEELDIGIMMAKTTVSGVTNT
jgi:hypothetical protein